MKNLYLHIIFFGLFISHLLSIYYNLDQLRFYTKPLICLALIYLLYKETSLKKNIEKIIASGLLFGCLGDTFLLFQDQFVLGLASFLVGHLLYIFAFMKQTSPRQLAKHKGYILVAGILATYSYYLFTVLKPSLGPLKIPVVLYIIVIALMAIFAFTRKHNVSFWSFLITFIAAILFMISDSILALNKFVAYIANSGLMIMSTYILAQYGITFGTIIDSKKNRLQ